MKTVTFCIPSSMLYHFQHTETIQTLFVIGSMLYHFQHTETIQTLFVTYFRILKKATHSALFPSALEGLARYVKHAYLALCKQIVFFAHFKLQSICCIYGSKNYFLFKMFPEYFAFMLQFVKHKLWVNVVHCETVKLGHSSQWATNELSGPSCINFTKYSLNFNVLPQHFSSYRSF